MQYRYVDFGIRDKFQKDHSDIKIVRPKTDKK